MKLILGRPAEFCTANEELAEVQALIAQGYSSDDVAVFMGFADGSDVIAVLERVVRAIRVTAITQ